MRRTLMLLALILAANWPRGAYANLDEYIARPEPAYRWELRGSQIGPGGTTYDIHMVSQVWQGITWEHRLQVFYPAHPEHPEFCALYNTGGSGSKENEAMGLDLARRTGAVYAVLYNIPNQPLFGNRTEDALVVYTWQRFLLTGDESWPLHFPMAKAVIKAMDTIQALARQQHRKPITGFLVDGASKRGWTTWLVGASRDPRVKAIAPMVIDVLNVAAQIPHQIESYGKPSEQVEDYTSAGMTTILRTPPGRRLLALEDPYSYRDRLTLPKLLILGTNDRYWSQDSLNLYWNDLKGPKWVLYTPNSGHGLQDRKRVYDTLTAFIRAVASGRRLPSMKWGYQPEANGVRLWLRSAPAPVSARLFRNFAPTRDFRDHRWTYEPIPVKGKGFNVSAARPGSGFEAVFGEATYRLDGQLYTLSTQIRILAAGR